MSAGTLTAPPESRIAVGRRVKITHGPYAGRFAICAGEFTRASRKLVNVEIGSRLVTFARAHVVAA
jgi:hypothetical protein